MTDWLINNTSTQKKICIETILLFKESSISVFKIIQGIQIYDSKSVSEDRDKQILRGVHGSTPGADTGFQSGGGEIF